jgi:hypothetical protein
LVFDLKPKATIRLLPADLAEDLIPTKGAKVRDRAEGTCRWIFRDVLGHAGGLTDRVAAEFVPEDD